MSCWPLSCLCGLEFKDWAKAGTSKDFKCVVDSHFDGKKTEHLQERPAVFEGQHEDNSHHLQWSYPRGHSSEPSAALNARLLVRTISGATVASLSPRNSEQAGALKTRINKQDGTAVFMQKLVQEGRVLNDRDVVTREPVVLVRIPRKRIIIASLHSDVRSYDLETGVCLRVVPAHHLRITCMVVDWETGHCLTGSINGVVRVWDVYSNDVLGTLPGLQGEVSAISSDHHNRLLAASKDGALRVWTLPDEGFNRVIAAKSHAWQTDVGRQVAVAVHWERSLALISGENRHSQPIVVAYNVKTHACLWSWQLPGAITGLVVDWAEQCCIYAPRQQWLELRGIESSPRTDPKRFAHGNLDRKGLFRVDWPNALIVFVAKPFALELWSLKSFEMLHRLCDASGEGADIISLDVDWSQSTPRAITCRTYMDWESIRGEVCIQDWQVQESGFIQNVYAEHPLIGGFDIITATAEF